MFTADQVTAIAPDAASFKAGRTLASPRKWAELAHSPTALWGLALGSGKKPYYTQVDLSDLATKCSCPSRKFPCKHALGLMFLAADSFDEFTGKDQPDWVNEWLESRKARAEKAATKKAAKPKDEVSAAKRKEKRGERIHSGTKLLDQTLHDILRNGLSSPEASNQNTWTDLSKRMVDSQAPGLASYVARLAELPHSQNWESQLLYELGSLHLLATSYQKKETLSPEQRADLEQLVGWPLEKEEVLKAKGIHDNWFVAMRIFSERDRLITSSSWLYGEKTRQWALVLQFSVPPASPPALWPLGSCVETELVFPPGTCPDRAFPRQESASAALVESLPDPPDTFSSLLERSAKSLSLNPWQTRQPFFLSAQPSKFQDKIYLVDQAGDGLPWKPATDEYEILLSLSAGHPIPLAGIWDGNTLTVHAVSDGGSYFPLKLQSY